MGEGLVSMSLVMVLNAINVVFLAVPVDELGTKWQGWSVVVATLVCLPVLMVCFTASYKRSDADALARSGA